MTNLRSILLGLAGLLLWISGGAIAQDRPSQVGGIYPHLAMMNDESECGTGAVVPWADRLWVVTYAPHSPMGSTDKLYEITPALEQIIRPESIGGTPANRMIHRESNQLNIGPYFIDARRNVRVIPYEAMPGRPTATARHLTDPANKLYITTMEEGLYEVDVHTLAIKCWINDGNKGRFGITTTFEDALDSKLPGYHGKGTYTAQGKLIYSNNGTNDRRRMTDPTIPSGALAQWGGPGEDWEMIVREQFTEVTGPGGIHGNADVTDPLWAMGWDHRSLILMLLDDGQWYTYRLPKASFSYDGAHGWNTEWPRIREIGTGDDMLATMHGTFWHFPRTFSRQDSAGIAPRSNFIKVTGDFARWGDYLVIGCNDSARSEFANKRPTKSAHGAPLRSNSNLWFVKPEQLSELGPALGSGGVWLEEDIKASETSDPYLFAGYDQRMLHLGHRSRSPVTFTLEVDRDGTNNWTALQEVQVPANRYVPVIFDAEDRGQWIRLTPKHDAKAVTAWFSYDSDDQRTNAPATIFAGLATDDTANDLGGVMRSLGGDDLPLGLIAQNRDTDDRPFYLINDKLELVLSEDKPRRGETWKAAAPAPDSIPLKRDGNSILVVEDGKRYRLPLNPARADDKAFGEAIGYARRVREVATERDLVNVAGTFYELPARNAGGFAHVRPIASHPYRIHDFCSWRGLLLFTGVDPAADNERIIKSADGKAAVWAGVIDELWQLGKPVGTGGPWADTAVKAGQPSDPYLMYGYDKKRLRIKTDKPAEITIQVDPSGTGQWHDMGSLIAVPDEVRQFNFYPGFNTHWVRLVSDIDATVTANFLYE